VTYVTDKKIFLCYNRFIRWKPDTKIIFIDNFNSLIISHPDNGELLNYWNSHSPLPQKM